VFDIVLNISSCFVRIVACNLNPRLKFFVGSTQTVCNKHIFGVVVFLDGTYVYGIYNVADFVFEQYKINAKKIDNNSDTNIIVDNIIAVLQSA
jgi:hypothetical protein